MKPAIILSAQTAALGVIRSLGVMGVPVGVVHYNQYDFAHRSRFVSYSLRAPHPEMFEDDFVDFLFECGSRFPGAILIPASDESLAVVSRHKEQLAKFFLIACTDWNIARCFIDKQFTYALAEKCEVPAPRTIKPRTLEDAIAGVEKIGLPCLLKPCQSHLFYERFGRKMVKVLTLSQLKEAFSAAQSAGLEMMLQEVIPGNDIEVVNYNAYFWDGVPLVEFTSVHVRNGPPWFGSPRVVLSRRVSEVLEPGRRMLKELGFNGYACTEFKRDPRDGIYKLMEVNGRHNLSTLLAVRCGINFPWLQYQHLMEGVKPQGTEFREEVYWIDLVRDLGYSALYFKRERYSLSYYIRPYFKPHVFAILDYNDLGPIFRKFISLALKIKERILGVDNKSAHNS